MDCLCINLDSQQERWRHVESSFSTHAAPRGWKLKRVPAVDIPQVHALQLQGQIRDGEKGCFMSHIKALDMATQSDGHTLIVEDDVQFGPRSVDCIQQAINSLPTADWDVLLTDAIIPAASTMLDLFMQRRARPFEGQFSLINPKQFIFAGMTAYVVNSASKAKCKNLLQNSPVLNMPVDLVLRDLVHSDQLKAILIFPFATTLSKFADASQLQPESTALTDAAWNAFRKLCWMDAEQSGIDALEALRDIPQSFYDKASTDLLKILAISLSSNFKTK